MFMTLWTSSSLGLIVVVAGGEVVGLRVDGGDLVVVLMLRNWSLLSTWNPNFGGGTILTTSQYQDCQDRDPLHPPGVGGARHVHVGLLGGEGDEPGVRVADLLVAHLEL